jgi:hypothetical protein
LSDAEDAARYRWLKAQFQIQSERNERDIDVDTKGGFKRYTTEVSYWHYWQLSDDWRFGRHSESPNPPSMDELIDEAMKERS